MANEVQDLGTQVQKTVGAEESAGVLIDGFAAYVLAHVNDPAALRDYATQLQSASDALAAKVAANPAPTDNPPSQPPTS